MREIRNLLSSLEKEGNSLREIVKEQQKEKLRTYMVPCSTQHRNAVSKRGRERERERDREEKEKGERGDTEREEKEKRERGDRERGKRERRERGVTMR